MPTGIILVIEDDPTLQLIMKKALTKLGFNCEVLGSGEEAVERDHSDVSLIFMDIGLPGIQGVHATMLIRDKEAKKNLKHVPIIALTGHAMRDECIQAGMDDFMQKPALIHDLREMVEKHLLKPDESRTHH